MVYVDNMKAKFGRMIMCHMIADTTQELLEMADKIGVARKWIQDKGTYSEHFDVSLGSRAKAVMHGAKEITMMELGRMTSKRPGSPFIRIDRLKEATSVMGRDLNESETELFDLFYKDDNFEFKNVDGKFNASKKHICPSEDPESICFNCPGDCYNRST